MAQYGFSDGAGDMFGVVNTEFAGGHDFQPSQDHANPDSILNHDDNELLKLFFQQPDKASQALNNNPIESWNMEFKGGGLGGGGFEQTGGTVNNPATSLAAATRATYDTHSDHPQILQMPTHMRDAHGNQMSPTSPDDIQAANRLFSMAGGTQEQQLHSSSGLGIWDSESTGAWGSMHANFPHVPAPPENLQSPLPSSGRPSTSSFPTPTTPSQTAAFAFGPQTMAYQHYQQQQLMWQRQSQGESHGARHQSLSDPAFGYQFYSQQQPHTNQSGYAHPQDPRALHATFGSDSNFSGHRYRAPAGYVGQHREKVTNLMDVPMAGQAAAPDQQQQQQQPQAYDYTHFAGQQHMPRLPNTTNSGSLGYHRADPSTGMLTSMTQISPMQHTGLHGHPYGNHMAYTAAAAHTADAEGHEESESEEQSPPHKRRRSLMEREDEAEYTPAKDTAKPSGSKRGPKVPKALDGSDDDEEYTPDPKVTRKRIKSNAASPASAASPDDAGAFSDTATPCTGKKKKKNNDNNNNQQQQARRNLTEEEKRQNHIKSEKNRRDLIKTNYEQLDYLVPALSGGKSGLSRSEVLREIVKYMCSVGAANEVVAAAISGGGDEDEDDEDDDEVPANYGTAEAAYG